jgi:hypothetical protein
MHISSSVAIVPLSALSATDYTAVVQAAWCKLQRVLFGERLVTPAGIKMARWVYERIVTQQVVPEVSSNYLGVYDIVAAQRSGAAERSATMYTLSGRAIPDPARGVDARVYSASAHPVYLIDVEGVGPALLIDAGALARDQVNAEIVRKLTTDRESDPNDDDDEDEDSDSDPNDDSDEDEAEETPTQRGFVTRPGRSTTAPRPTEREEPASSDDSDEEETATSDESSGDDDDEEEPTYRLIWRATKNGQVTAYCLNTPTAGACMFTVLERITPDVPRAVESLRMAKQSVIVYSGHRGPVHCVVVPEDFAGVTLRGLDPRTAVAIVTAMKRHAALFAYQSARR